MTIDLHTTDRPPPDPVRRGHGAGEGQPHVEIVQDEQPATNAEHTATNLALRRLRGRPFELNNAAAAGRLPNIALLGVDASQIPELTQADIRKAARLRKRRVSETRATTGYVSAGASAMFGSSALAHVASRRIYALAFATDDPKLYKLAAELSEKSAQLEIKARWTAKDEAAARPRGNALDALRARLTGGGQ